MLSDRDTCPHGEARQKLKQSRMQMTHRMIEACKNGDLGAVADATQAGAVVTYAEEDTRYTALHYAALKGHRDIVLFLLDHGARVDQEAQHDWTPLQVASILGNAPVIEALVAAGANTEHQDDSGSCPIHKAASHGRRTCLDALHRFGAYLLPRDDRGWTPLHAAAFHGHLNCIIFFKRLDTKLMPTDLAGYTPAHYAVAEGHLPCLKYFVRHCTTSIFDLKTKQGETLLMLAQRLMQQEIVDYIDFVAQDLVEADVDAEQFPLHVAAFRGDAETVRRLLVEEGMFIDLPDHRGCSPLHKAAGNGQKHIVRYLLNRKANRALCNFMGETPFDLAMRYAHAGCAVLLRPVDEDELALTGNVTAAFARDADLSEDEATKEETEVERQQRLAREVDRLQEELLLAELEYKDAGGTLEREIKAEQQRVAHEKALASIRSEVEVRDEELARERKKREALEALLTRARDSILQLTAELGRTQEAFHQERTSSVLQSQKGGRKAHNRFTSHQ
eukprot:m.53979 g.53979  ORF g.53979 m.53979 type:complete len:505 (+) comp11381_c0_seq1:133-1647(+)